MSSNILTIENAQNYSVPELVRLLKSTRSPTDHGRITKLLIAKKEKMTQEALLMKELGRAKARVAEISDALKQRDQECEDLRRENLKLEEEKRELSESNEVLKVKEETGIIEAREVKIHTSKLNAMLIARKNVCGELREIMSRLEEEKKLIRDQKERDCEVLRREIWKLEEEKRVTSENMKKQLSNEVLKVKKETGIIIESRFVETQISKLNEMLIACKNECYELKEKVSRMEEEKKLIGDEKERKCEELRREIWKLEEEKRGTSENMKKQLSTEVLKVKKETGIIIKARCVETQISKLNEMLIACQNESYELKEEMFRLEEEKNLICSENRMLMDREARREERCKKFVEDGKSEKELLRVKLCELERKNMELQSAKRSADALVELYKRRDVDMGARAAHFENEVAILLTEHAKPLEEINDDTITRGFPPSVGVVHIIDSDDEEMRDNTLTSGLKRKRLPTLSRCDNEVIRHSSQSAGLHDDLCSTVPTPSHSNTSTLLKPCTKQPD